jgi:hypothetical protein
MAEDKKKDKQDDAWYPGDLLAGITLSATGAVAIACAWLAMKRGLPAAFRGGGWFIGPVFLILGVNAVIRGFRTP